MSNRTSLEYYTADPLDQTVNNPHHTINTKADIYLIVAIFISLLGLFMILVGGLLSLWTSGNIIWIQWVLIIIGLIIFITAAGFATYLGVERYRRKHPPLAKPEEIYQNHNILYIKP